MALEPQAQRARDAQVGLLMKVYRESFANGIGKRGLSQDDLLRRMAGVDPDYAQRFSHATVSRWESGVTRPTVQRLRVFGKALHLSKDEVDGLILLAGLAPEHQEVSGRLKSREMASTFASATEPGPGSHAAQPPACGRSQVLLGLSGEILRFFVFRFLLLGALIAGFHYLLSALGWQNAWMPVICVAFATLLVLAQGFPLRDAAAGFREFYWTSVFVVLTTPMLQFVLLGMDHYNFHLAPRFATTMMPYMLALLVNLGLAWLAGLMFHLLWRWQYRDGVAVDGAVAGAAWVTIPPLSVVYAVVLVITNLSVTVQLSVVFAVLTLAFSLLLVFSDRGMTFTERDRRTLFQAMATAACVSVPVGIAVIISIYLSPDFPSVLPDHNLVRSWELDFGAIGYTREEALERVNIGYSWHAMCLLIYMSCVVGGRLFLEIYRMGNRGNLRAEP